MAKRGKAKKENKSEKIVKAAKKNKKSAPPVEEKPKASGVDEMPDSIEDPAAVFKMAMLDMKHAAITNKLALVVHEHEKRVAAAVAAREHDIKKVKAELRESEGALIAQRQHIETTYGISLRAYTYNEETGVLTKHGLPEDDKMETSTEGSEEEGKTVH